MRKTSKAATIGATTLAALTVFGGSSTALPVGGGTSSAILANGTSARVMLRNLDVAVIPSIANARQSKGARVAGTSTVNLAGRGQVSSITVVNGVMLACQITLASTESWVGGGAIAGVGAGAAAWIGGGFLAGAFFPGIFLGTGLSGGGAAGVGAGEISMVGGGVAVRLMPGASMNVEVNRRKMDKPAKNRQLSFKYTNYDVYISKCAGIVEATPYTSVTVSTRQEDRIIDVYGAKSRLRPGR